MELKKVKPEWIDDLKLPNDLNLIRSIEEKFIRDFNGKFDDKLKEITLHRLAQIGYTFITDKEFYEFVSERVMRCSFEDRPNYYKLYLDFVNEENKGTFLFSYRENTNLDTSDLHNLRVSAEIEYSFFDKPKG